MSRLYSSPESYAVAVVASPDSGRTEAHRTTMPFNFMSSISPTIAFNKDASPTAGIHCQPDQIIQRATTSLIIEHDGFA
jgi:hypothetical protein